MYKIINCTSPRNKYCLYDFLNKLSLAVKKPENILGIELKSYENMKRAVCKLRICDIFNRLLLVNAENDKGVNKKIIRIIRFCKTFN